MIKALNRIFKQDKEKLTIPKSVQQVIPVKRIWLDGIWQVGNKYSRCWKFTDINYAIAQLELYEQDPNFCFIRDHHKEAFPKGETKATRLAGINPWKTAGFDKFRKAVLNDDLVSMRRDFRTSYEEKAPLWAEYAKELQDYLSKDHSRDDMTPVRDSGEDEEDYEEELDTEEEFEKEVSAPRPETKPSLQEQIQHAAEKRNENKPIHVKEEQLTLF